MAWRPHPRLADTDPSSPRGWATCQRCGFIANLYKLEFQRDWRGMRIQNLQILVCEPCYDTYQRQLGTIILPPDPTGLENARPEPYPIDENWPRLLQKNFGPRYLQGATYSRQLQANWAYNNV